MRRLLSMLLLVLLGLPLVSPLLALGEDTEAAVPMCCRKGGEHHCLMRGELRLAEQAGGVVRVGVPPVRCPYCPAAVAATHGGALAGPATAQAIYAGVVSHPAVAVQTECRLRVARDRSRQKRGPPSSLICSEA